VVHEPVDLGLLVAVARPQRGDLVLLAPGLLLLAPGLPVLLLDLALLALDLGEQQYG
jgi:hypothetical protein